MLKNKLKNLNETIKEEKKPKFLKDSSFTFFVVTLILFFIPIIFILSDSKSLSSIIFLGVVVFTLVLLIILITLMPSSSQSSSGKNLKDVDGIFNLALTNLKSHSAEERLEAMIIFAKLLPSIDLHKKQMIANDLIDFIKINYSQIHSLSFEEEKDEQKKQYYYDKLQLRNEYKQQASKALKLMLEIFKHIKQRPNLSDFYLGGLDLNFFDFSHAILNKTNFEGSDLFLAKFKNADLFLASFKNCNLCMANFEMAHLEGVNLENANASDAKLYGANLSKIASTLNTNFTGAKYNTVNIGTIPPTNFPKDFERKEDRDFLGMNEDNILVS